MEIVWAIVGIVGFLAIVAIAVWIIRRQTRRVTIPDALHAFEQERRELHEAFFQAASSTGKPRGLKWKSCEFGQELELARDKRTGELLALLPVTIAFEAIPGSDMEGLPAVS